MKSAETTFGLTSNKAHRHSKKQWFDLKCLKAKKEFRKSKRLCKKYGSNIFKERLRVSELSYKKTMDNAIVRFNTDFRNKMKNMRTKNPKEFWKLFHGNRQRDISKIPLQTLVDFFKDLNTNKDHSDDFVITNEIYSDEVNEMINKEITADEIRKAVKKAKNNKSPGDDLIINEYISSSLDSMIDIYVYLFNLIFDTGIVPESWLFGNVLPIFKNKGSKMEPTNYRPIRLLSCIGKIFTSILNDRLSTFFDHYKILHENQAGFRSGYSTNDHIFSLFVLFQLLFLKRKKLYCAFVDFEKAFDFVHRNSLFFKLLQNHINGKFFRIVKNMYQDTKSCIVQDNEKSEFVACDIGVRQGENLSPILFFFYI